LAVPRPNRRAIAGPNQGFRSWRLGARAGVLFLIDEERQRLRTALNLLAEVVKLVLIGNAASTRWGVLAAATTTTTTITTIVDG